MSRSPFRIGTSGWRYDHWRGPFYPPGLAKQRWFDYYAARFDAVEVNATFYRRFHDETYLRWRERAPAGFRYVLKVPRLISHRKRLHDCADEIAAFRRSAALLGEHRDQWYASDYTAAELAQIAHLARDMVSNGAQRVYLFFNNDHAGFAPHKARQLRALLR